MKVHTRSFETSVRVRDAAFIDDQHLLATDGAADIWKVECQTGQAVILHQGAHILGVVDRSLAVPHNPIVHPCGGAYPLIAVANHGPIVVATHDMVLAGKVPAGEWKLLSELFGSYYPQLLFNNHGTHALAVTDGVFVFEMAEGRTVYEDVEAQAAAFEPRGGRLLVCRYGGEVGWVALEQRAELSTFVLASRALPMMKDGSIRFVALLNDASQLVVTYANRLGWIDLASWSVVREWEFPDFVESCAAARNGTRAVLEIHGHAPRVVALDGTENFELPEPAQEVRISPSGRTVLTLDAPPSNPYPMPRQIDAPMRGARLHRLET